MGRPRKSPLTGVQRRQLEELYASLPKIECKGECWDSCGPIAMTPVERGLIDDVAGVQLPLLQTKLRCPALGMFGTCTVYEVRPLICRLWGLVPSMRCNFGCMPEGGLMRERDGHLAIARAYEISGDHGRAQAIREVFATEDSSAAAEEFIVAHERARKERWAARREHAEASGTQTYVDRMGRVSRHRTERAHE